jgi:hypothetical protein
MFHNLDFGVAIVFQEGAISQVLSPWILLRKPTQSGGLCSSWNPDCERPSRMFQGHRQADLYAESKRIWDISTFQ